MGAPPASSKAVSALRWLLLPWWLAQVFTGEKSFWPNPILGDLGLNRRGLAVWGSAWSPPVWVKMVWMNTRGSASNPPT